ncbi:MAG: DUF4124 domain-containing protein [Psychromonas sp.]
MKFSLFFLSSLFYLLSSLSNATEIKVYRWIDEQGQPHFSDTAVLGAEEINIKSQNLFATQKNDGSFVASKLPTVDKNKTTIDYQAIITSPENDQALRSNNGTLNIHVSIEPEKKRTQTLQLYLDAKKLGSPQISPTLRAFNVARGTHQIQVKLLDESGIILTTTQVITLHILRVTNQHSR